MDGSDGPGAWITDRAAEETGLGVGDLARIGAAEVPVVSRSTSTHDDGIYMQSLGIAAGTPSPPT